MKKELKQAYLSAREDWNYTQVFIKDEKEVSEKAMKWMVKNRITYAVTSSGTGIQIDMRWNNLI